MLDFHCNLTRTVRVMKHFTVLDSIFWTLITSWSLEPHSCQIQRHPQRSREHCSCLLQSAGLRPGLKVRLGGLGPCLSSAGRVRVRCEVTDSSRLESGLPFIQAELFWVRLATGMTHNRYGLHFLRHTTICKVERIYNGVVLFKLLP